MDAVVEPIERLVAALKEFVGESPVRLLSVVTSGALRMAALEQVAAAEHHSANQSPFFVLEAPVETDDDGWETRAEELRLDVDELRTGLAAAGLPAPGVWPAVRGQPGLARFGLELGEALHRLSAPLDGLMIVLAPAWVRDAKRWAADVQALVTRPELAKARFVVVDLEVAVCAPAVAALGAVATSVDARVSDAAASDDLAAMGAGMASAPAGATGPRRAGMAGPDVAPPPRADAGVTPAPGAVEAGLVEAGVAPAYARAEPMQELRGLIFAAAGAMKEGRTEEAVRKQRAARDLCVAQGLTREAIVMTGILGGYLLQGGAARPAHGVFGEAQRAAVAAGHADLAVQMLLASASALTILGEHDDAAVAYADAGQLGAHAGHPILAIEAFRMCGQLLAARKRTTEAASAWRRALSVAEQATPEEQQASSAPQAARALAALCRKHGLVAQADSLEAQADSLEAQAASLSAGADGGGEP